MQLFSMLLLFALFNTSVREDGMVRFQETISRIHLGLYRTDIRAEIFPAFTFYEVTLLALVFILALIKNRKRRMNKRLQFDIDTIKNRISSSSEVVGKLSTYLEESRSRNSGIESPLRRTKRSVEIMMKEVGEENLLSDKLAEEFNNLKGKYLEDSFKLSGMSNCNVDNLRVKAELAMLKRFIVGEVNALRKVGDYYKALIDEAEDDVTRFLASEGI